MKATIDTLLAGIETSGNMRRLPADKSRSSLIDFSSNDYLGLAHDKGLREKFLDDTDPELMLMSASASRLLARCQKPYEQFEHLLSEAYRGRQALVFNSGYHANTGLISALAVKSSMIIADKLVHASIIDGIKLAGVPFERFRHNNIAHLDILCKKAVNNGLKPFIIAESIYSMDGDTADLAALVEVKKRYADSLLYIDEAHAVGASGPAGLGLSAALPNTGDIDIIVGTLGKALASTGAYAISSQKIKDYALNRARSLIFSTALPPVNIMWSMFVLKHALTLDDRRTHLHILGRRLQQKLAELGVATAGTHIQAFIIGNPHSATAASAGLADAGFDVLPIRTPTVPPGTDRLRISLSAAHTISQIDALAANLATLPHS